MLFDIFSCNPVIIIIGYSNVISLALQYCYKWVSLYAGAYIVLSIKKRLTELTNELDPLRYSYMLADSVLPCSHADWSVWHRP